MTALLQEIQEHNSIKVDKSVIPLKTGVEVKEETEASNALIPFADNPYAEEILELFLLEWQYTGGAISNGTLKYCLDNSELTKLLEALSLSPLDAAYFRVACGKPFSSETIYESVKTALENDKNLSMYIIKMPKLMEDFTAAASAKETSDIEARNTIEQREWLTIQDSATFLAKAQKKLVNQSIAVTAKSIRQLLYTLKVEQMEKILGEALGNFATDSLASFMIGNNGENSEKAIHWMVLDYMVARTWENKDDILEKSTRYGTP